MTTAATLTHVSHDFDGQVSLDDVSLSVATGERVALLGPSGAGKSTLLALLDGRLRGWKGTAQVLDHPLSVGAPPPRSKRADVGFIFQEFALVERQSVYQNVMNGRLGRMRAWPSIWGRYDAHDHMVVTNALQDTAIAELAARRADQLSGGQRQRVAIARCLAQEPNLILADEPVSSLDPAHAGKILALITSEARKRDITVVFSSHQPEFAQRYADRVLGLRDGKVLFNKPSAHLTPEDINQLYHGTASPAALRVVS